jgi:hypothetical protein
MVEVHHENKDLADRFRYLMNTAKTEKWNWVDWTNSKGKIRSLQLCHVVRFKFEVE